LTPGQSAFRDKRGLEIRHGDLPLVERTAAALAEWLEQTAFIGTDVESTYCCPVSKCSPKNGRTSLVIRELLPQ
jgi:hypothetical protein